MFGTAPSGFYTRGRIYYDLKDKEDDYACKPLDVIEFAMNEKDVDNYPILMLDRGDCTFVTKARNAQNIGARIALVVNDEEGPVENILMIDDGTGSDVNIPVILIRKEDGDIIKKFMNDNRDKPEMLAKIKLEIDFETVRLCFN